MAKADKWLMIGLSISILSLLTGYLLWAGFSTAEQFDQLPPLERYEIQQTLAVNYEWGAFLLNAGFTGFSTTLLALLVRKALKVIKGNA